MLAFLAPQVARSRSGQKDTPKRNHMQHIWHIFGKVYLGSKMARSRTGLKRCPNKAIWSKSDIALGGCIRLRKLLQARQANWVRQAMRARQAPCRPGRPSKPCKPGHVLVKLRPEPDAAGQVQGGQTSRQARLAKLGSPGEQARQARQAKQARQACLSAHEPPDATCMQVSASK